MPPFACPRCGSVSHSRHDALEGYCGCCHDWTGGPEVLAAMSDGEYARYLELQRAAGNPAPRRVRRLGRTRGEHSTLRLHAMARPPDQLLYGCPRCGIQFTVPPEHGEPVLCGFHSPPERMSRVIRGETASIDYSPVLDRMEAAWDRPDADPLRDIQEAYRLVEAVRALDYGAIWEQMAGRGIDMPFELGGETADALQAEIQRGLADSRPQSWAADAVAVWEGCKDAARRERSLAELAQDAADSTPQIAPSRSGVDCDTAARWSPDDPGDVIL